MIFVKFSWLISISISALDIVLPLLFNLLLANITSLLRFFFLFCVVFNSFFTIHINIENLKLKLAPVGISAPIIMAKEAIDIPPLVLDKIIKVLSK